MSVIVNKAATFGQCLTIYTLLLLSIFSFLVTKPAMALVIEETPDHVIEQRAIEAERLYQPLLDHFKKLPNSPDPLKSNSDVDVAELMALMSASDHQKLEFLDRKLGDSIDSDTGRKVISWLSTQNSLELNLLKQLGSYPQSRESNCLDLISTYRTKIISANEDTLNHLKKYKDDYKVYNFVIQWVFNLDYMNRVLARQDALILTNVCVNPNPFFTGESLRQPLAEPVYVGKSIEPSLNK